MTHLYEYATKDYDWITMEWSGLSPEEEYDEYEGLARCGEWGCPGDCYICQVCEDMFAYIALPVYGPKNKDGADLGFLFVKR